MEVELIGIGVIAAGTTGEGMQGIGHAGILCGVGGSVVQQVVQRSGFRIDKMIEHRDAVLVESGRDGITGARAHGAIGFSAIRGGDIVGEHDVICAGAGERVILRHVATDRGIFARGALRAAIWGQDKSPGEYDMIDVLGL